LHSYTEQRDIVTVLGLGYLGDHPLAANITARIEALMPVVPVTAGLIPAAPIGVVYARCCFDTRRVCHYRIRRDYWSYYDPIACGCGLGGRIASYRAVCLQDVRRYRLRRAGGFPCCWTKSRVVACRQLPNLTNLAFSGHLLLRRWWSPADRQSPTHDYNADDDWVMVRFNDFTELLPRMCTSYALAARLVRLILLCYDTMLAGFAVYARPATL